jgi:hypothetical protein
MPAIETYSLPLRDASYSTPVNTKVDALCHFLGVDLSQNTSLKMKITGHRVDVGEKAFWFDSDSKKVLSEPQFKENGTVIGVVLSKKESKTVRDAVKAISAHASDLEVMKREVSALQFCGKAIDAVANGATALIGSVCEKIHPSTSETVSKPETRLQIVANKIKVWAKKNILTIMLLIGIIGIDVVGVIRNLLDLIQVIGTLVSSPWFLETITIAGHVVLNAAYLLGSVIAGFRILQGCASLVRGIYKLHLAVKAYKKCQKNHDVAGMEIARAKIGLALVNILTGVFWIALGILFLSCPQLLAGGIAVSLAYTILSWILVYGLFAADSALEIHVANKIMRSVDKHHLYLLHNILNNNGLTAGQMMAATKGFLRRFLEVSGVEKAKIREKVIAKFRTKVHRTALLPSELDKIEELIQERIKQKLGKKRGDLKRTLGFGRKNLEAIFEDSNNQLVQNVLKSFERHIAQQDASRFLNILCLAVIGSGLLIDIPTGLSMAGVSKSESKNFCNVLQMGMPSKVLVGQNDGGWILINFLLFMEHTLGRFTKLFEKSQRKVHEKSRWYHLTHSPIVHTTLRQKISSMWQNFLSKFPKKEYQQVPGASHHHSH